MDDRTNRFVAENPELTEHYNKLFRVLDERAGKPVERPVFEVGELLELRNYIWRVRKCEGSELVLEGVGLVGGGGIDAGATGRA